MSDPGSRLPILEVGLLTNPGQELSLGWGTVQLLQKVCVCVCVSVPSYSTVKDQQSNF